MAIKGNNSSGLISVPAGDVMVLQNTTTTRQTVTAINLHEYGNTGDTIEIFKSADAVSAAAERIDEVVLAANDTVQSLFTPVNLAAGEFLLANGATGGLVNIEAIYTAYTGDS
jgi:hypothetical protein